MAIATERWSDRQYVKFQSAVRSWDVVGTFSEVEAIAATGASEGGRHPLDIRMMIQPGGLSVKLVAPTTSVVTANYTFQAGESPSRPDNPLDWPTEVEVDISDSAEAVDEDYTGAPIVNGAGLAIEPKATDDFTSIFITAYKWYSTFELGRALRFMNRCNENAFNILGFGTVERGQCKCKVIKPTKRLRLGESPLEVMHRFELRGPRVTNQQNDPSFRYRFLNQSFSGWWSDNGTPRVGRFTTKDAATGLWVGVTDPVRLTSGGVPIDSSFTISGNTPIEPPQNLAPNRSALVTRGTNSFFISWQLKDFVDFSPLIVSL